MQSQSRRDAGFVVGLLLHGLSRRPPRKGAAAAGTEWFARGAAQRSLRTGACRVRELRCCFTIATFFAFKW